MKHIHTFESFLNEAKSINDTSVFFYIKSETLTNVNTDKIFSGWKSKIVDEKLSTNWIVFVKHIKDAEKAQSIIDSVVKKFPKPNSITYQSGLCDNNQISLIKGSYVSRYVEKWFEKTILELI
jgi:hypothetical protein